MSYADPNDSQSYEDWINELATRDDRPRRGWQAYFQSRCECCGKFVQQGGPGVSWAQQWSYDYDGTPDLHDPTYRCSPCTDKHGMRGTNCNESQSKYHGRTPAPQIPRVRSK